MHAFLKQHRQVWSTLLPTQDFACLVDMVEREWGK